MAGIRITELPSVDDIRSTDQLIIARGETTRKAYGTALVTKQDITDLSTFVSRISAGTLNVRESQFISLYYDNQSKTLSAEIEGVLPATFGGTGYASYVENQLLIADAFGKLQKTTLTPGRGVALSADVGVYGPTFTISNTENYFPIYASDTLTLKSTSGRETVLASSTTLSSGIMSSQDKTRLDGLHLLNTNAPLIVTASITATSPLLSSNKAILLSSNNEIQVTLPYAAEPGSAFSFIRAGAGAVTFVANPNVQILTIKNDSYKKISYINGKVTAYFKSEGQWQLTGDLSSTWDRTLTGPNSVDGEQKIGIFTNGSYDSFYYKNEWNKITTSFRSMTVQINGTPRAVIDFTEDRLGKSFGYRLGPELGGPTQQDPGPTYFGTFASGNVNLV